MPPGPQPEGSTSHYSVQSHRLVYYFYPPILQAILLYISRRTSQMSYVPDASGTTRDPGIPVPVRKSCTSSILDSAVVLRNQTAPFVYLPCPRDSPQTKQLDKRLPLGLLLLTPFQPGFVEAFGVRKRILEVF